MAFVSRNQWFLKPIFCQFHACIIGSGPSGFSVAGHLLKHNDDVKVDILEKLIAPFGLIRYGVAPDHQDIKNFTKNYEKIAMNPRVTYWGGVDVGRDVSLNTLLNIYDCVVLCYGRNVPKKLNIPGEKLSNVFNSCEIVGWYNGHPHYAHIHPNLQGSTATIIGNGNVALDIARILSSSRRLTHTDITLKALNNLKNKSIKKINIVGRRGPFDVSFTTKELREIKNLSECELVLAEPIPLTSGEGAIISHRSRLIDLMRTLPLSSNSSEVVEILLTFDQSIVEIRQNSGNRLVSIFKDNINNSLNETTSDMIIHCIGYDGVNLDPLVPFDTEKCIITNRGGRVLIDQTVGGKLYCSGWIKTGSKGILADTIANSYETARNIAEDFRNFKVPINVKKGFKEYVKLNGLKTFSFDDWRKIDNIEILNGKMNKKIREKIVDFSIDYYK